MNIYSIKVANAFGKYTVCKWEAASAEEAVREFKAINPAYNNKGLIVAE